MRFSKFSAVRLFAFIAMLTPCLWLILKFTQQDLGANPVEFLTHETGKWTLIFLLTGLAISPLKNILGWKAPMKLRRMVGLYAFFYACLHLMIYWVFDQSLSFAYVWEDILKRPYITIGFSAWLLLIPLAITSANYFRKRMGKNWIKLHKLAYVTALLGLLHYIWLIRADYAETFIYAAVLFLLLGYRLLHSLKLRFKVRPEQA